MDFKLCRYQITSSLFDGVCLNEIMPGSNDSFRQIGGCFVILYIPLRLSVVWNAKNPRKNGFVMFIVILCLKLVCQMTDLYFAVAFPWTLLRKHEGKEAVEMKIKLSMDAIIVLE